MTRFQAWTLHVANLLVGGTGLVYAWMRYFLEPMNNEFSILHHPWEPLVKNLHLWTAPLLVFAAGLIWQDHIWKHFRRGVRSGRRSGLSLMLTLVPMVISGYLIQTAVDPNWQNVWIGVHLTASGLWLLGYVGHYAVEIRRRARRRQADRRPARARLADG